jgi:hypothetical protein
VKKSPHHIDAATAAALAVAAIPTEPRSHVVEGRLVFRAKDLIRHAAGKGLRSIDNPCGTHHRGVTDAEYEAAYAKLELLGFTVNVRAGIKFVGTNQPHRTVTW